MIGLVPAAAAATSLAVLLARPPPAWVVGLRVGGPSARTRAGFGSLGTPGRLTGAGSAVLAAALTTGAAMTIVAAAAVGVALFAHRQVRLGRARAATLHRRSQTGAALDLLAAELRAGILPRDALTAVAADLPMLHPAAVAASHGGDVVAALRSASHDPGAAVLADLAGAWHVAERAGAPLAAVLDRVAASSRDDAEVDREVQAEAAPARATGRLMAVLPVLGLSLGAGMGADPVHVLTGTVLGASCLAAGLALACAGLAWIDHIVASAEAT